MGGDSPAAETYVHELHGHHPEALLLEPLDDLSHQPALDPIGLDGDEGALAVGSHRAEGAEGGRARLRPPPAAASRSEGTAAPPGPTWRRARLVPPPGPAASPLPPLRPAPLPFPPLPSAAHAARPGEARGPPPRSGLRQPVRHEAPAAAAAAGAARTPSASPHGAARSVAAGKRRPSPHLA